MKKVVFTGVLILMIAAVFTLLVLCSDFNESIKKDNTDSIEVPLMHNVICEHEFETSEITYYNGSRAIVEHTKVCKKCGEIQKHMSYKYGDNKCPECKEMFEDK